MISRSKGKQSGFTLIEALLAMMLVGFILSVIHVASAIYRDLLRTAGSDIFEGRSIAINPDDSTASKASGLAAELTAILPQARFVLCANAPQVESQIATQHTLPGLSDLTKDQLSSLRSESLTRQILGNAGLSFSGQGYTEWLIGSHAEILAVLRVERRPVSAGGDDFLLYSTNLYGSYEGGFGLLYSYEFVSPVKAVQPVDPPHYNGGVWRFSLPDPSLQTETPGGLPLPESPASSLTYEAIAHF